MASRPAFAIASLAGCLTACAAEPAPRGEALLVVQSDVAVPRRIDRLRVDVYASDGKLIETRDLTAPNPADWPISFSVVADQDEERIVTVRLRAYREGHVVSRAELARTRPLAPLVAPGDLAAACAAAPLLRLGEPLVVRRGPSPITTLLPTTDANGAPTCAKPLVVGSAVARLDVKESDVYRIELTSTTPTAPFGDASLSLRTDCLFPTTQLACLDRGSGLPTLERRLEPGVYWVVTGGSSLPNPADLTLRASRVDAAVPVTAPPPAAADASALEPEPGTTIDRLVRLRLVAGERGTLRIGLRGECFGTPADLEGGQTCIDRAGTRVPVGTTFTRGRLSRDFGTADPPWAGDVATSCEVAPRPASPLLDDEVCIPGGSFVLGDTLALADLDARARPERTRVVAPFFLDRYEVTVGRFRDAIRRGLIPLEGGVLRNNDPLGVDHGFCTWNQGASPTEPAPGVDREAYPLNCVTWAQARAFCQSQGADLPTEDQWEYAASAAGRSTETQFPWGSAISNCDRSVLEQSAEAPNDRCARATGRPAGPARVDDALLVGQDVTPLGVVGLSGNVTEWLVTGFLRYDDPAWDSAGLRGPLPAWSQSDAPLRAVRGGDWAGPPVFATVSARRALPPVAQYSGTGFRCARSR